MATTSASTDAVTTWAYQYTLACMKLTNAENAATSSSSPSEDIATAKTNFATTMESLLPTTATSSVQFEYYNALTTYNTDMAAADTSAKKSTALDTLYTTLSTITQPTATSSTLSQLAADTLALQKTNLSNAKITWNTAVASSANLFNTNASNATGALKSYLASFGVDTSGITAPTYSNASISAYAAGALAAANNGTPGEIMNAALYGYMVANPLTG